MAVYPLNSFIKGRDISRQGNKPGTLKAVRPAKGPDGKRGTAYRFFGRPDSYIEFPNSGPIDTKYSITILGWIFPEGGKGGPIFQYSPDKWGVHFWITGRRSRTLFARYASRRSLAQTLPLRYRLPRLFRWYFVGTSYDYKTRIARLFVNDRVVYQRKIGRNIQLATNFPVRVGVKKGDNRYYKGKIACLQVYNMALSVKQVIKRRRKCFSRTGNYVFYA